MTNNLEDLRPKTNLLSVQYTSINLKYDESFLCFLSKQQKNFYSLAWAITHKKSQQFLFFHFCTKRKKETKQKKQAYFVFWRAHITTFSNYNLYNMTLLILAQFFFLQCWMQKKKYLIYTKYIKNDEWARKKKSKYFFSLHYCDCVNYINISFYMPYSTTWLF